MTISKVSQLLSVSGESLSNQLSSNLFSLARDFLSEDLFFRVDFRHPVRELITLEESSVGDVMVGLESLSVSVTTTGPRSVREL